MALPEVTERLSHGEPTWFVRDKKTFVMYADHHHDERLAFWCAAPEGAQEMLARRGAGALLPAAVRRRARLARRLPGRAAGLGRTGCAGARRLLTVAPRKLAALVESNDT